MFLGSWSSFLTSLDIKRRYCTYRTILSLIVYNSTGLDELALDVRVSKLLTVRRNSRLG